MPLAKPHSFSPVDDQPLELNPTSKDDKDNADMPTIAVEEGNLDTTNSKPSSEYFDEYEFNHQHQYSIYNKSNVTEKMSKDISDKQLRNLFFLCHLHDPDKSTHNPLARQR